MKLSGAVGTKARLTSHDVTAPAIAADKTEALTGVWQTIDLDHGTVELADGRSTEVKSYACFPLARLVPGPTWAGIPATPSCIETIWNNAHAQGAKDGLFSEPFRTVLRIRYDLK
jgi:hypothetical protein